MPETSRKQDMSENNPNPEIRRVTANQRKDRIQSGALFDAPPPRKPRKSGRGYNLVALLFLLATLGLIVYFALIWVEPFSPLNPLAPPTPLPIVVTATPSF